MTSVKIPPPPHPNANPQPTWSSKKLWSAWIPFQQNHQCYWVPLSQKEPDFSKIFLHITTHLRFQSSHHWNPPPQHWNLPPHPQNPSNHHQNPPSHHRNPLSCHEKPPNCHQNPSQDQWAKQLRWCSFGTRTECKSNNRHRCSWAKEASNGRTTLIPDLGLSERDQFTLLSPTAWLTDKIINATQKLLKAQSPDVSGFQSVACGLTLTMNFNIEAGELIQILHTEGHWLTISTPGTYTLKSWFMTAYTRLCQHWQRHK